MHNFSVWGFCDSEKKDERYAVPSTVHEIPSLASSCTASLAYATPCLMFSKRCSADATSSCLSIIDKLRSETLLLACIQRWKIGFLQMSILSRNYVRKVTSKSCGYKHWHENYTQCNKFPACINRWEIWFLQLITLSSNHAREVKSRVYKHGYKDYK